MDGTHTIRNLVVAYFHCYILVFININPLLELDGYYLLMDWLGINQLRHKSLESLRLGLPGKMDAAWANRKHPLTLFRAVRSLSADERIFVVFGLLAVAWTAYAVSMGLMFWQTRLANSQAPAMCLMPIGTAGIATARPTARATFAAGAFAANTHG